MKSCSIFSHLTCQLPLVIDMQDEVHKSRVRVGVKHLRRSQYLSPTNHHVRLATLELQTNGVFWLAEWSIELCNSCVGTVDTCTINIH
jgi:hypothetical protein